MIHADSKATNLVDQKMLYVAISRAKTSASVYTNDQSKLITALKERAGETQMALAGASIETGATANTAAPLAKLKSAGAGMG
jgi:ATP-dependent exoDNAse (exonuclease V) alpha subunit